MEWVEHKQTLFRNENWSFSWKELELTVNEVCDYHYSVDQKPTWGGVKTPTITEEINSQALPPHDTLRNVFEHPLEDRKNRQKTLSKGRLLFVDMLLSNVNEKNLNMSLQIAHDLKFPTEVKEYAAQRKIFDWIQKRIDENKNSKANNSGSESSPSGLHFLAVMLGRLVRNGISSRFHTQYDCPLKALNANLLLHSMSSFESQGCSTPTRESITSLSGWLVSHADGNIFDLFFYFFPLVDVQTLIKYSSKLKPFHITDYPYKEVETLIDKVTALNMNQIEVQLMLMCIAKRFDSIETISVFLTLCQRKSLLCDELSKEAADILDKIIRTKQLCNHAKSLLHVWKKVETSTPLREMAKRHMIMFLCKIWNVTNKEESDSIRELLLTTDIYQSPDDIIEIVKNLLKPRTNVHFDVSEVYLEIIRSKEIMSQLSAEDHHGLLKHGIEFMVPSGPLTVDQLPVFFNLYRFLACLKRNECFHDDLSEFSKVVFEHPIPLMTLIDCLSPIRSELDQVELEFVKEHILHLLLHKAKGKQELLEQLKGVLKSDCQVQVSNDLELQAWQAVVSLIETPDVTSGFLQDECITSKGEIALKQLIRNIDLWLLIFGAFGDKANFLLDHENCQTIVKTLKYITSMLESGKLTFQIFDTIRQKQNADKLKRLFVLLDAHYTGLTSSWETALTISAGIHKICRQRVMSLSRFSFVLERLSPTVLVTHVEKFKQDVQKRLKETETNSKCQLCHTTEKDFWGPLYGLIRVAMRTSTTELHKSSIFLNICRSVFEKLSESADTGLPTSETDEFFQYADNTKRTFQTDVFGFANVIDGSCLPTLESYCKTLFDESLDINVSIVQEMLADVKDKHTLSTELDILSAYFGRHFHSNANEALMNFASLDDLKQKSRQLQVVFNIFDVTDTTESIPQALKLMNSLSDRSIQENLSLKDLDEAIKEVQWIDKQFEGDDWKILEQLARCTDLIIFLRPIIERNEDLRKLVDAVEEHAEQSVNAGTVANLIDVQRYVESLVKLKDLDKAKHFASTIQRNKHLREGLAAKISDCSSNTFSLIDLYNHIAKREEITKVIIHNALDKGTYSFFLGESSEACSVVMSYESDNRQKSYNLDELNDLRSRALLIVNSRNIRAKPKNPDLSKELQRFIDIVTKVKDVSSLFNDLHKAGHFEYRQFRVELDDSESLDDLRDRLTNHKEEWLGVLHDVRERHYYLNFFHSQQLFVLDQFFHEGTPASIEIEQLLQFVDQDFTLTESYRKYYHKPDNSSDMKLRLQSLGEAFSHIFPKDNIPQRRFPPFEDTAPSFDNTVQPGKVFIVDLDQGSQQSIPVLLELYRNTSQCYPEASQVLFCNHETTEEELSLLIQRCRGAVDNGRQGILFSVVNVELLATKTQSHLVREIRELEKLKTHVLLAIICRGGSNHPLIDHFSRNRSQRIHGMNDNEVERCLRSGWKNVEVVTSDLPGLGKTEYIVDKAADQDMFIESILVSGPITKDGLIKSFLQRKVNAKTLLHINTDMISDQDLFDTFLFELIVLGRVASRNHTFRLQTDHVSVEIANTSQNKLRNSLPTCRCFNRKSLGWSDFDDFIVSQELHSPVQVVCHYLKALAQSTLDTSDVILSEESGTTPLSADECRSLLRNYFAERPKHEMSFTAVETFLNVFSVELERMSTSVFFRVKNLALMVGKEDRKHLRSELVKALAHISEDFSARSVRTGDSGEERSSTDLSRFHAGSEITAEHMISRVKNMIKWEISQHLVLMFNSQTSHTLSLLYRRLQQVPSKIRHLFEKQLNLHGKDLQDYRDFSQPELQKLLERVCRYQNSPFDTKKLKELENNYALTPDNVLKMVLIHMRIKSRIPVIIMGETGCGKTTLITYLARVCEVPFFHFHVHAGTKREDILEQVARLAEEAEKDKRRKTVDIWVFFDEINTCDHLGLLNEIILHHTCEGQPLPSNLVFMGACNPYQLRDVPKTTAGLDHVDRQVQYDEQSKLVYRVHPLPEGMMDFVWDYGSLDPEDETRYVQRMVEGITTFSNEFAKLLCMSQDFVRKLENTHYCVSLRDVRRTISLFQFFRDDFLPKKKLARVRQRIFKGTEDKEREIRAFILSLAHCYHSRLLTDDDRRSYRTKIAEELTTIVHKLSSKYVEDVIKNEQMDILNKMELPQGTAKNVALRENVFVILICILNKIPVFVVGKPGCSKSLSMQLIVSNLRGLDSKSDFFRELPTVFPVSFQGSESSTSEGILKVFQKAERMRRSSNTNTNISPVVLLDEIGLAEISRYNPLKVLHSLLEPASVAVVGISNWALDAAKMNRAIHLSRPEPTKDDLYETARFIRDDVDKRKLQQVSDDLLRRLAEAYLEYVGQQVPDNFHGLRDYYSMVKYITTISSSDDKSGDANDGRVQRGLLRNFGGLRKAEVNHMINIFMDKMAIIQEPEKHLSVLDRIRDNLKDKLARHLMIITSGDSVLTIVEQALLDREHKVMFGSRFEDDDSEEYNYRVLSEIILCMERGITLVLRDLESIYGSLYDMLNQNYTPMGDKWTCRIAHGPYSSPLCEVHQDFRCIVLVDEQKIDFSDPPFLNRFEKQMLKFPDIISDAQVETIGILRQWMNDISSVDGTQFGPEDMFLGLHSNTLPSLVYYHSSQPENDMCDPEELSELCKDDLMRVVCPDAALRSSKSKLAVSKANEVSQFQQKYFSLQQHDGFLRYSDDVIKNTSDGDCHKGVVYTYASIHTDLIGSLKDNGDHGIRLEKLSHFKSERQLSSALHQFWLESSDNLLVLQCSSTLDAPRMLLAKCLLDQYSKQYCGSCYQKGNKAKKHVFIIVHIDRNEQTHQDDQPSWQFNYLSGWQQVTIDDIVSCKPGLSVLVRKSVTKLIAEKHVESEVLAKDQIFFGMTCMKYVVKQRELHEIKTLVDKLTSCPQFLDLLQPHILHAIEDEEVKASGTMIHSCSWQVKVACNKELLGTRSTLSAALMEHIKTCIRRPIGKIMYFLEQNCAWFGIPSSDQPDDTSEFWKICFKSDKLFDINSPLIPEPRGLETCMVYNKLQDFKYPFFMVFHEKIESHRELLLNESKQIEVELCNTVTDDHIVDRLSSYLNNMMENSVPQLDCNSYLEEHLVAYYEDLCMKFAEEHFVDVDSPDSLQFVRWLFDKKLTVPSSVTAREKVARWYIGMWMHKDLIATELRFLYIYQDILKIPATEVLDSIKHDGELIPKVAVESEDQTGDDHDDDTRDLEWGPELACKEEEVISEQPSVEDVLIKCACTAILPLESLLKRMGGIQAWQRKASLLLLLAGKISAVPPIFHFLRLCRDFTAVLTPFKITDETVAALAEFGISEEDALATVEVFDFIGSRIDDLMEDHTDKKSLRQLQELLCMFYVRALESNPDTPALDQILRKLISEDGRPIAGARPVLYRIIKTDIDEYELSDTETPVCESIIETGEISDRFPNLRLLNDILTEDHEMDNHLAVITCDILEEFAFEHLTADQIRKVTHTDDIILERLVTSVRILQRSTCDLQALCAAAFIRAFLKSAVEVLKHSNAEDIQSSKPLYIVAREINNILTLTDKGSESDGPSFLLVYVLKLFKRHFSMYDLKERCISLGDPIAALKSLPWQEELFQRSRLVYNPLSYVTRYKYTIDAIAEWQIQNKPSKFIKVISEAKSEESYRLALLAGITETFFFTRSAMSVTDTDKEQAKWVMERKEMRDLDPDFQIFIEHIVGVRDFSEYMQLNETTPQERVEQISVIFHLACVILSSNTQGFKQYLRPNENFQKLYLPGGGNLASVLDNTDMFKLSWKAECSNCRYSIVGSLETRAYKKCPICSTRMKPIDTVKTTSATSKLPGSNTSIGYTQVAIRRRSHPDISVSSLSPAAYCVLSIAFHSCLMVGLSMGLSDEEEVKIALNLHKHNIDQSMTAAEFLKRKIDGDWSVLKELLQFGSEDLALFIHTCIQNASDILKTSGEETLDPNARDTFQRKFSYVIDMAVESKIERSKAFKRNALECMGSKPTSLEQDIDELKTDRDSYGDEAGKMFPRLLRHRTAASFSHLRASVINQSQSLGDEYLFLRLFFSKEKNLCLLRNLRHLLMWNRLVSERLNLRIERREASRTIDEFLSSIKSQLSDDDYRVLRNRFSDFRDAWKNMRDSWKLLTGKEPDFDAISLNRPISLCVIEEKETSNPLRLMIEALIRIQNQFLHLTMRIAASGSCQTLAFLLQDTDVSVLQTVPLEEAHNVMIDYKWDDYYLIFCDINTEHGKGAIVQYDYTAIERELARELVLNKANLSPGQTFSRFSYSDELFHACSTILLEVEGLVPQKKLPKDVRNTIVKEDETFKKNLLEHLEVLILFLKKSGGSPEKPLYSYIKDWSSILPRSFPADLLPKPRDLIKLRHIVGLYEALEDLLAPITISNMPIRFLAKLEDSTASQLAEECKKLDVDNVQEIFSILRRFVFRYLRSGINTNPKTGLIKLMHRAAGNTLRCDVVAKVLPKDVIVGQVVDVLEILEKQVEVRITFVHL